MRVVMFAHSLVSDWNHGNAHFLRGVVEELLDRDCAVRVFEPEAGWSRTNLVQDHGIAALERFSRAYPRLHSETYDAATLDLDDALAAADLVIVHEWNDHELVARIGEHRSSSGSYVLMFHDTHHRSVTDPTSMSAYDLRYYDGVLAFGDAVRDVYVGRGWCDRAWTWHEAADTRRFRPQGGAPDRDIVWIGNWGDEERTAEIDEFLIAPVKRLGASATVYGVRYPAEAVARLADAGIEYKGWLPNYEVPSAFARHRLTVHIPRRPYLEQLPGIPTIRPFEALACGIPLVCARWDRTAGLFAPGEDFFVAHDGDEMTDAIASVLASRSRREALARKGLETVRARHTCAHRVDELMHIYDAVRVEEPVTT